MFKNDLEKVFECLLMNVREDVIVLLCNRYKKLSREDGEDIFQEGSCVMWNKMLHEEGILKRNDFKRIIFKVCRNIACNSLRDKNYEVTWDDRTDKIEEDENEMMRMKEDRIDEIMNGLNKRDRDIIHHYYVDNWSLKEIAEELRLKNGLVAKNIKCRIVKRLRAAYEKAQMKGEVYIENVSPTIYNKVAA